MHNETVAQGIIRSSLLNFAARIFGYLKNVAIAVMIGFNFGTDAFFMALSLIGLFLIFADVFDSVGIPNLVRARQESEEHFYKLSGLLFTFTTIVAALVGLLSFLLMPWVLKIAVGFKDQKQLQVLKELYLYLLPYLVFSFFFRHFGAINRSLRRFSVYFLGQFIFSLFTFIFIVLGFLLYKNVKVIPISYSIAQAIATIYILIVSRNFIHFSWFIDERTKKILKQFSFLLLTYGTVHMFIIVDRAFASMLQVKSITALAYGLTIASIPRGILMLENILITPLSETNADKTQTKLYLRNIFLAASVISVVFFVFSPVLVKLLYGYGAFSNLDYELTSLAAKFYSLSIPFMLLWPVLYRILQIKNKFILIAVLSIISVFINALLNYIFVIQMDMDLIGICLGTFGSYLFVTATSYFIIAKT